MISIFSVAFSILVLYVSRLLLKFVKRRNKLRKVAQNFVNPPRTALGFTQVTENGLRDMWTKDFKINVYGIFHYAMTIPRRYGLNVVVWGLFNHFELFISDPKDLETILTGRSTKKGNTYEFVRPWLGDGLLISHGQKWFQRRKLITTSFHFSILEQFLDVFNEQDRKLAQKLKKYVELEECNIYKHLSAVALDNICETAMGVKINCQDNPNTDYVLAVTEMTNIILARYFSFLNPYPRLWNLTPAGIRSQILLRTLHEFTEGVIRNRRQQLESKTEAAQEIDESEGKKKFSFLDMLLQATIDGKRLSDSDIREEVDTFMFEGHDTTTSAMTFSIYNLAMHPEVQERVFNEVRNIMGDDPDTPCTLNTLSEMKYLDKVIKETLRLYPSVPVIQRKVIETTLIQGVPIEPKTNIQIPIYAAHRNPYIFPEPEKFDPERFNEDNERTWGPFDYIPFSAGSRNCVGQKFAMLEMKSVLSTILRHYKVVATAKTRNMKHHNELVLRTIGGLFVKLETRKY